MKKMSCTKVKGTKGKCLVFDIAFVEGGSVAGSVLCVLSGTCREVVITREVFFGTHKEVVVMCIVQDSI